MKIIAICYPGMEDICATEAKELCLAGFDLHESAIIFEANEAKVLEFCYLSQSSIRVLGFLGYLKFQSMEEIVRHADKINISTWLNKNMTFKVECNRAGEHDFTSETLVAALGEVFHEKYGFKVDLSNPDCIIHAHVFDNNCYIGVDLTRTDLSKRDYKVFAPAETIKAPIAYGLLRIADYQQKDVMLNPYTGSGMIAIEAALYMAKKSINFYRKEVFHFEKLPAFKKVYLEGYFDDIDKKINHDKLEVYATDDILAHVKYAQKNAKVAGVEKLINMSKVELEWLDTKFEEKSITKLIAHLPSPSKHKSDGDIAKIYKEFFYQMEYVLAKGGIIVTLLQKNKLFKQIAAENKFKIIHERRVYQGGESYWVNVSEMA